jgi:hypothetical protein
MAETNIKGPKGAWIWGGAGALCWMPVLIIVIIAKGGLFGGLALSVFLIAGIAYLYFMAPWKHPDKSLGKIYSGLPAIIIAAAISVLLTWPMEVQSRELMILAPVLVCACLPMFLPVFLLVGKSWNDIHRQS